MYTVSIFLSIQYPVSIFIYFTCNSGLARLTTPNLLQSLSRLALVGGVVRPSREARRAIFSAGVRSVSMNLKYVFQHQICFEKVNTYIYNIFMKRNLKIIHIYVSEIGSSLLKEGCYFHNLKQKIYFFVKYSLIYLNSLLFQIRKKPALSDYKSNVENSILLLTNQILESNVGITYLCCTKKIFYVSIRSIFLFKSG